MNRSEYLSLCRDAAIEAGKSKSITPDWPESVLVEYRGDRYAPKAYELKFDASGQAVHIAVLRDVKANSVLTARLDKVKRIKEDAE